MPINVESTPHEVLLVSQAKSHGKSVVSWVRYGIRLNPPPAHDDRPMLEGNLGPTATEPTAVSEAIGFCDDEFLRIGGGVNQFSTER